MLLAGSAYGQVSCPVTGRLAARSPFPAGVAELNAPPSRPGIEHQLLIHALAATANSPMLALAQRIDDCGCNLSDARVATLGADSTVALLAEGSWDAVAKLETALGKLARNDDSHLTWYRTTPRDVSTHLLPYLVEVVAAERPGILLELMVFFSRRGVSVEQLSSMRYQAMHTGAAMFSAQITIGVPAGEHIAALREDFLELCDGINLDAIMEPVKF